MKHAALWIDTGMYQAELVRMKGTGIEWERMKKRNSKYSKVTESENGS